MRRLTMDYKKGDKVKHPKQDVWGLGIVLEDQRDDKVRIFFENVGEKILSTKFFLPIKVTGIEAQHPVLDKLKANSKFLGLTILLNNFLLKFPNGFQDANFLEKEVYNKQNISEFAHESLNQAIYNELLAQSAYTEITHLIKSIIHKDTFSMIDRFEKIILIESLENKQFQQLFAYALYDLLYGDADDFDKNFMEFAHILSDMNAGKWTIMTYFLFIFYPQKHIFLKPTVTQNVAKICEFNLHYEAVLNIVTYHHVLKFANYLLKNLKELGLAPEDMVDVQSFMWVVEKY